VSDELLGELLLFEELLFGELLLEELPLDELLLGELLLDELLLEELLLEGLLLLEELVSCDILPPECPCQPRAFIDARVATESTPPCDPQTLVPLLAAFEPSLQTTVSIALMRM